VSTNSYNSNNRITFNERIRFPEVRVLSELGESLGVMSSNQALARAQEETKDLVLVTEQAQPPVVKIIKLSKYKYQLQRKQAKARKKNRTQDLKELRLSMFIGAGDLLARKKRIKEFLKDGDKVRLSLQFKGREIAKKEFAYELFASVINEIVEEKLGTVEIQPKIIGRKMMAQLTPA